MLRFTVILLIFLTNVSLPVNGVINLAAFQQEALLQHNVRRQQHCVPPLTLNSSLNTIAQNYANFLAVNGLFNHSATAGLGENLWSLWTSGVLGNINGSTPTESWYGEISSYNYNSPGFASNTGHFTQVVWLGSTQLGIGIALDSANQTAKVVANYAPPGNFIGSFPANVLPVCTTLTTTTPVANSSAILTIKSHVPMVAIISSISFYLH